MNINKLDKLRSYFKKLTPKKVFPIILIVFGLIGATASLTINVEKRPKSYLNLRKRFLEEFQKK